MTSAVSVKNLVVQFGEFKAVNHITFDVPPGELFGFLGANGAGKTTTIRVLCGLLSPTEGQVEVAGISPVDSRSIDLMKSKVGYMSQKFTLYDDMTIEENLSFIAALRKIPQPTFEERKKQLFDFVSFHRRTDTVVRDLPGGMKQQMALVGSLLHDPEIIFLDEPTAGVSSAIRAKFWNLIKELAQRGKTVFITSHYMDEVEQCDRIALMRSGELIALDSPKNLKRQVFPDPLYELRSQESISYAKVEELKNSDLFESFEPYGLHYHALPKNSEAWRKFLNQEGKLFTYKEIAPTLEDVFIRLVEGKTR